MNDVTECGRLKKLTELKKGESSSYIYGTIETIKSHIKNQKYKYDYIPFVAFGKTAEFLSANFKEGMGINTKGNLIVGTGFKLSYVVQRVFFQVNADAGEIPDVPTLAPSVKEEDDLLMGNADLDDDKLPW